MNKIKIKVVSIGHLPAHLDVKKIKNWKSSIFEIVGNIDNYALRCDSDGPDWEFSDALVREQLPKLLMGTLCLRSSMSRLRQIGTQDALETIKSLLPISKLRKFWRQQIFRLRMSFIAFCMQLRCYT
jgi:hypothetical protein